MKILGVVVVLVALLGPIGWLSWTLSRFQGLNRLQGRLSRVEIRFQSWGLACLSSDPWRDNWVGSDDPVFLQRVEAWLNNVKRSPYSNALEQSGGTITLVFQDGRREDLLFRGPSRPGPSNSRCGGFLWEGQDVYGEDEPFTELIRDLGVD
jgi:hypothetical protein